MDTQTFKMYKKILEEIHLFRRKKISFFSLVQNLETYYRNIGSLDPIWSIQFFDNWINLENINATLLQEEKRFISQKNQLIIDEILSDIANKTQQLIQNELLRPNYTIKTTATLLQNKWLLCPLCQETWESESTHAMIRCPNCNHLLHNPHYK